MKLSVAIATSSSDKIEGIRSAISRFFSLEESEIEVFPKAVDSEISEQPFGDETYEARCVKCYELPDVEHERMKRNLKILQFSFK